MLDKVCLSLRSAQGRRCPSWHGGVAERARPLDPHGPSGRTGATFGPAEQHGRVDVQSTDWHHPASEAFLRTPLRESWSGGVVAAAAAATKADSDRVSAVLWDGGVRSPASGRPGRPGATKNRRPRARRTPGTWKTRQTAQLTRHFRAPSRAAHLCSPAPRAARLHPCLRGRMLWYTSAQHQLPVLRCVSSSPPAPLSPPQDAAAARTLGVPPGRAASR
jgi:hypothetical protein